MEFKILKGPNDIPYIEMREDNNIWEIPIRALTSWGALLGIDDPVEVLNYIVNYDDPSTPEVEVWPPLYDALHNGLDELARAGVPPEFMATLIEPDFESPIPGPRATKKIKSERVKARGRFAKSPTKGKTLPVADLAPVVDAVRDMLEGDKTDFMDSHSRSYTDKPQRQPNTGRLVNLFEPPPPIHSPKPGSVPELSKHQRRVMQNTLASSIQAWASSSEGDAQ